MVGCKSGTNSTAITILEKKGSFVLLLTVFQLCYMYILEIKVYTLQSQPACDNEIKSISYTTPSQLLDHWESMLKFKFMASYYALVHTCN